jgi:aryl-alcohol dehydrogenase-like predicted oxidoreductase
LSGRRDEFYLATKCGCDYVQHEDHLEVRHRFTAEVVRRNIETSLRRLRTDYLDLLQFHGGDAQQLQREGLIELLEQYRQRGVIRYIGVSSSQPQLRGMIELGVFDTFQIPYSCLAPQHEDRITAAGQRGAGVIIRGGIGKGGPEAEIQREEINRVWEQANLDELQDEGMSPAELILRFTLSHPYCHTTIVGTCNDAHLEENLRAAERGPLPEQTVAEIRRRVQAVL